MTKKRQTVCVTGATGYVAGILIETLLDQGHTVHGTVRQARNEKKVAYLEAAASDSPGILKLFDADLMSDGSFTDAMTDCSHVFHTASPFFIRVKDPEKDLIIPAKMGTRNVLTQASRTSSVKRVIVTSSCAAIYGDNVDIEKTPDGRFTEASWNESSSPSHQPYSYSKTVAEREAWKIANSQSQWDLVTINPSFVLGPGLNPHATGESNTFMKQLGEGKMKAGLPDYGMGVVDVRDVADAHIQAAFRADASGRHLTSGHNSDFLEIARLLRASFGEAYPFPKRELPKWLVWLVGPLADKAMTRQVISRNVGKAWIADNSKSKSALGLTYRPLKQTLSDHFQQLLDAGVVSKAA